MKKSGYFLLMIISLISLAACGHQSANNQLTIIKKVNLKLSKHKIYDINEFEGKATKGATVIFIPHNKHKTIEKVKASSHDGTFWEGALVPGTYTVYAKIQGKRSPKQEVKVLDYFSTHSTPDDPKPTSADISESISESKEDSEIAASVSKSFQESMSKSDKQSSTKSSYSSRYKKISLTEFTENTSAYVDKDIQTTGSVIYIQKKSDDHTMYYVVIVPQDEYDSSDYSTGHGTATEISADDVSDHDIHEGDTITVRGGGLQDTVELNGETLNSDIIVDSVSN